MKAVVQSRHYRFAEKITRRIWCVVGALWPTAELKIYGSFSTGLCIPSSDLDLVVLVPSDAGGGVSPMQLLATELSKQRWVKSLQPLYNTKVPVIKLVSVHEDLPTDITFDIRPPVLIPTPFGPFGGGGDHSMHYVPPPSPTAIAAAAAAAVAAATAAGTSPTAAAASGSAVPPTAGAFIPSAAHRRMHAFTSAPTTTGFASVPLSPYSAFSSLLPSFAVSGHTIDYQLSHLNLHHNHRIVHHTGVHTCRVVQDLKERFPALEPLVLVVKQYLNERGLNEVYTGGLASYSLVLMMASFLQKYGGLVDSPTGETKSPNLGALLLGFLELYGKQFDFDNMGVSISDGGYDRRE